MTITEFTLVKTGPSHWTVFRQGKHLAEGFSSETEATDWAEEFARLNKLTLVWKPVWP